MDIRNDTERIVASESIALVLPKNPDDDCIGAALACALHFQAEGKNILIFSETPVPDSWKCLDTKPLRASHSEMRGLVLSIDTRKRPISEIRYEKSDDGSALSIIIDSKDGALSPADIAIEGRRGSIGSVIAIGAKNISSIGAVWKDHPELFYEKPLISLDTDEDHPTIAEKTFLFLKETSVKALEKDAATALLFSIFSKTDCLKNGDVRPSTLEAASELMRAGADQTRIARSLTSVGTLHEARLWGRACVRSKTENGVFWSFLTADDFTKTATNPSSLSLVVNLMEKMFALPLISVFLWQDPKTKGVKPKILTKHKKASLAIDENAEFPTFLEAEEHIRQLLAAAI